MHMTRIFGIAFLLIALIVLVLLGFSLPKTPEKIPHTQKTSALCCDSCQCVVDSPRAVADSVYAVTDSAR